MVHNTGSRREAIHIERKVLRKIHGPVHNQNGEYKTKNL